MNKGNFKFCIENVACCTVAVSVDTEQKISLAAAAVSQGREELVQGLVKVTKSTQMFQK